MAYKPFMIYHTVFIFKLNPFDTFKVNIYLLCVSSSVCKHMVMDFFSLLKQLDELLGESLADVDWRRSFYLNMVAHTSFTVTVAICR